MKFKDNKEQFEDVNEKAQNAKKMFKKKKLKKWK